MKLHLRYGLVLRAWSRGCSSCLAMRRTPLRIPNTQSRYCRPAVRLRGWLTAIRTCRDTGSPMAPARGRQGRFGVDPAAAFDIRSQSHA